MSEVQRLFEYYVAHQDEIVSKYNGKHVVLVEEKVDSAFDSEIDAYRYAMSKFEPGTFMIQLVGPGQQNYTQTFHSRVVV